MINLMARESTNIKTDMSTRETLKMEICTDLAYAHGLMGKNMMAAGTRIRSMEQESSDGPMEIFTKAASKITN